MNKVLKRIGIFIGTFFAVIFCFIIASFGSYIIFILDNYRISEKTRDNIIYCTIAILACSLLLLYKHIFMKSYKNKINLSIDIITILSVMSAYFWYENINYKPSGFFSLNFAEAFFYICFYPLILYVVVNFIIWCVKKYKLKENNNQEKE